MADDPVTVFLRSKLDQQAARAATATVAPGPDPDAVAEGLSLGKKLGVPASVVTGAPDVFRKQAVQRDATKALEGAPKTQAWLQDRMNAAIARDDLDSLSWFEKNVESSPGALTRSVGRGVVRLGAIPSEFTARESAQRLADAGRGFDDIYAEELARIGGEGAPASMKVLAMQVAQERANRVEGMTEEGRAEIVQRGSQALAEARQVLDRAAAVPLNETGARFRDEALANADNTLMGVLSAFASDPEGGMSFIAQTAAEALPVLAASTAATAVTRSPVAGVGVMSGGSLLVENANSAMEFLAEKGVDLSTPEAAATVLENTELMQEAAQRGLTRGLIITMFDAVSGGVAGQTLSKSPMGDVVVQGMAQMLLGSAGEGAAQVASGQEVSWQDIVVEGLAELATAPVEVAGVAGRGFLKDTAEATGSGGTAARLAEIDKVAAASKLKQRAPDKFQEALEAQGGGDIYVPASDLREYFQAKDVPFDDDMMEAWGIDPAAFSEAEASGNDVAVSEAVYASRISGTEDAAWFAQNGSLRPDEMSLTEAQRFNESVRDVMMQSFEDAEQQRLADEEVRASDVQVYDNVFSQLRAAGRTRDVAANEARVWSSFWRAMGERYGADPLDLARSMGVDIRGPQTPEVARRRGDLDLRLNTLRSQGEKALRPSGQSLVEFVKDKGGIADIGGDVEVFDPPKGLIAETAAQYRGRVSQPGFEGTAKGRGRGLDEMGRLAIEAGYFPELIGETDIDEAASVLAALQEELSGRPLYPVGEGADPDLVELSEALSAAGIDLALSNDEIAAALQDAGDGQAYDQDGRLITDTPEFKEWFGDSKVVDENGDPLVVYHGSDVAKLSSRDFAFDAGRIGSRNDEGFYGRGFYFTQDRKEAGHYAYPTNEVASVYLSIQNPFIYNETDASELALTNQRLRAAGVDESISASMSGFGTHNAARVSEQLKRAGFDGVVLRFNHASAQFSQVVAFDPTQIKSTSNRGTFDPDDPRIMYQDRGQKRGSIVLPRGGLTEGQTVINLFESADLSTFLHESGHFFLEAFTALATSEGAPQAMRDDLDVIHKFLGVEDGAALARDQHETWARGFEAYLMEGKAPSLELADAFARFKSWLTRIYQTIKGLNVKLTPEVREVMDRMLATDAEIAAARDEQQMSPMFMDQAASGMSDAAWKTYQRMARRSGEQASQALLEKTMAKVRREKESWWKSERADVEKEVAQTVNSRREFRLIEAVANKTWIGSDRDVPDIQMNRAELVEMFGPGVLQEINRKAVGGKRSLYADGGNSLGEVADFFGFKTPSEMITSLQNAGKRKDVIAAETDRIMTDRYGDPLNDGTIEEEALAAVHSEQQAKTLATEVRHLSERAGRPTRNMTAKVFRQRARMMLGRMSVKEATRPDAFLAAERKASKRAEDAFARVARGSADALTAAARHKEQQLLNHYLYLESRDLTKMVASKREKMRDYAKKSVREKLEGGYIEQIDAILEDYDFRVRSAGQVARSESLADFVQRMENDGRLSELSIDQRLIDRAKATHYSRLSVDDLRGLFDTIANIDKLGRFKQKLIEAGRKRDLMESVRRVTESIAGSHKDRDPAKMYRGLQFLNLIRRPDTILVSLDGGEEMGATYDELKRSIDEGQATEQQMGVEMVQKMDDLFTSHYTASQLKKMQRKKAIAGETEREWSKTEIIALALNVGNQDNFQRLMAEDVSPDSRMDGDRVSRLLGQLDENDWRFVQGMWDQVNSLWPDLAAIHKRRTGVEPKKVEAQVMVDAPSFVTGGYYPIKYDPTKSASAQRDEESMWDAYSTAGHGASAAISNGMTKQRMKTGNGRTLLFDLSVPFQHMRETVRYIALSEAVDATSRILRHPDVVEAFQRAGMQDTQKTLELWLKDTARGPIFNTDLLNTSARFVKNNFTLSKLAFNMKTVFLQVTGLGQSAAVIGNRAMVRGTMKYMANPRGMISDVTSRSALMAERQTTFQKDIYDFMNDTRTAGPLEGGLSKAKTAIAKAGFWPMIKTQFLVVDMPTWVGAYDSALADGKSEAEASHYADRMVVRAQDSGLFADRAAVERGTLSENTRQADFIRVFTTLAGYMLTKNNRAQVSLMQARKGFREAETNVDRISASLNAASELTLLFAFEAMFMGLIYALMTDEEDDEDLRDFMLKETGMAVVGGIPMVRDAASAFNGYGGGGVYGSVLEAPASLVAQIAQGDIDKALRRSAGDMVGLATGLPTTATLRAYEGILEGNTAEGIFGTNPLTR